jgi:hypothetical protein
VPLTVSRTDAVEPAPLDCSVTEPGLRRAVRVVELVVATRETGPLNPLTLAKLMLVALFDPASVVRFCLTGTMLKSMPATVTSADADKPFEVPVTLTTAFPD